MFDYIFSCNLTVDKCNVSPDITSKQQEEVLKFSDERYHQ